MISESIRRVWTDLGTESSALLCDQGHRSCFGGPVGAVGSQLWVRAAGFRSTCTVPFIAHHWHDLCLEELAIW